MPRTYDDGLVTADYAPADDDDCLALERLCVQGEAYRLSFRRRTFRRRAENFAAHTILVARLGGKLVGVGAMAFKDVVLRGEPLRAAFYFDGRVHPDHRGRGIGKRITAELLERGLSAAQLGYTYVIGDNATALRVAAFHRAEILGAYSYLVLPTYRERAPRAAVEPATMAETHAAMLAVAPPFELYTNPLAEGRTEPWVASFVARDGARSGGCSVWDNREILGEVIEALPPAMRAAGRLFRSWPLRAAHLPHLPLPGEALRSWYLFDVFGSDPAIVVDVVRRVTAEARARGIDWCYLPHVHGDTWVDAVRDEVPHVFAPIVPYRLLVSSPRRAVAPLQRFYVDVRDL